MGWLGNVIGLVFSGTACFAYATGYDAVIYRTIMNWTSDIFLYLLAKGLEFFIKTVELLPDYSFENYQQAAEYTLTYLAKANTIFPVVELLASLIFLCGLHLCVVLIRVILKIVPGLGG